MTTYQVQDPQGKVHEFEGPEGASPDQILAVAQRQFGHGDDAPPPPPASPEEAARAAGMEAGRNENPVTAGSVRPRGRPPLAARTTLTPARVGWASA
jgi:hypothetical protein